MLGAGEQPTYLGSVTQEPEDPESASGAEVHHGCKDGRALYTEHREGGIER